MTIQSSTSRVAYIGDNVSTVFPVPFLFFSNVDVAVVKTAVGGGVAVLTLNVDYTLAGAGVPAGGTLTKIAALLTGETLGIFLDPPRTQLSHYLTNDLFPAATLEVNLDREVQISQRIYDIATRAIRAPDSDNNPQLTLPSAAARASKYLTFDANGDLLAALTLPSGTLSQASIGAFLYPQSAAESLASVTPTNIFYPDGNVLRYGADPTGATDSTFAFQKACFSTYSGWVPTTRPRQITVPAGRYKFAGTNTAYGTATVFLRAGMSMIGSGMGTFMDCSPWGAVATNVFQAGWGFIGGVATQDAGGQPPEMAEMFFLGGPSGGGATISHKFPGGIYHHMWFSGPGLGIYMGGCWLDSCEFDIGLQGIVVGGGNQTITNCRFFNQNFNISFDAAIETSDVIINGCCFEYTQFACVQFPSGAGSVKGIKLVGCDFFMNAQFTTFSGMVTITQPNAQIEIDSCSFHNWGNQGGGAPAASSYALTVNAAGALVDVKDCVFDGLKTNSTYAQSGTSAGILLQSGTLRIANIQFRNLPATYGYGIVYGGAAVCSLQINGCLYSAVGVSPLINILNSNAASSCYIEGAKGDGATPLINAQGTVITQLKNLTDWFGPITTSGASHVVLGVPYQFSNVYQITVRANINAGGNASYRKSTMTFAEKDNDFAGTAKSFIATTTPIQGAANLNGVIATVVEFGAVGGTQTIALSNSGNLAISWPSTYSLESVDVQVIM